MLNLIRCFKDKSEKSSELIYKDNPDDFKKLEFIF